MEEWERDVWKDAAVWCQFSFGAHYNDRETLVRNPGYVERNSKWSDIFFYGKLDVFF
ncbi:MAG TPA: hypothetical protein PKW55_03780 [Spirochaetota bacterium]|nr:hypothetical protein [Spirochaetota bacterium]HOM38045.1 hypothetical protein [Spirochaetota bacterium]HPQ48849.1 hypothetical protein [Spirochaetota bacterium]